MGSQMQMHAVGNMQRARRKATRADQASPTLKALDPLTQVGNFGTEGCYLAADVARGRVASRRCSAHEGSPRSNGLHKAIGFQTLHGGSDRHSGYTELLGKPLGGR